MSELELGQMVFSNNNWKAYDAYWATSGLAMIAEIIEEIRGDDGVLTSNYGAEPYENDVFAMRTYCWCDGEGKHEDGCPPNFEYKPTGVEMTWYKHAGRGITCNKEEPSMLRWFDVISHCIESVRAEKR